jgi:hypothetical protein
MVQTLTDHSGNFMFNASSEIMLAEPSMGSLTDL